MLQAAIVVFREVLEAALVVGIVMAATKGVMRRAVWVWGGVAVGVVLACVVAAFANAIAAAASGVGPELFNASVLLAAVAMLGWHCVWMSRHGREISQQMKIVGRDVATGSRPLYALAIVVGLAVLREGSEIVLFLYGIAVGGSATVPAMAGGGLLGVAGGVALGVALYYGLLRIPMRHLFTVTTWMIIFLAAGMASQATAFLVQAGLLPALGRAVWNSSAMLSEKSLVGQILHALLGYDSRPSGIQIVAYLATLAAIGSLTWRIGRDSPSARQPAE